jgi:hypothetical protein
MDSLLGSIDSHVVLVVAAIAVLFLLVRLLFRVLSVSLGLILTILAIVLVLQYGFDISPSQLWGEVGNLPGDVMQFVKNLDLNALASRFSN